MSSNGSRGGAGGNGGNGGNGNNGYVAAGIAAGVAALLGGAYWLSRSNQPKPEQPNSKKPPPQAKSKGSSSQSDERSVSGYLTKLLENMSTSSSNSGAGAVVREEGYARSPPPAHPALTNLNALLSDIYVRFVQIRDDDFTLHYRVFDKVFHQLHQMMKDVDPYYRKYSSTVQFAGSHYDNLRIKKPDEFDMDIVIDLPLNLAAHATNPADSDIFIEPKEPGFVQLRMGVQFQKLPMRDGQEWQNNKAAYEWMDGTKYLLRSKFLDWFKGVVDRALNKFEFSGVQPLYYVDGVPYKIRKSGSGPAVTLIIENASRGFKLDVDLVPALKFPESRWPVGPAYRRVPARCARGYWMVVGKPIKAAPAHDQTRSWRLALHLQERELMHDSGNLRQAMRLIKKLRDSLGMKCIASYYIKTLFFWEIVERNDSSFWHKNNPAYLFKLMVGRLHAALVNRKIPYFWNKNNNLIGGVEDRVLFEYAAKLVPLIQILEVPLEYKRVAMYLLTPQEFRQYNANFLHI